MSKFFEYVDKLDDLIQTPPGEDAVTEFVRLVQQSEVLLGYGFRQLDRPDWLMPLKAVGLLNEPPSLERDEDGNIQGRSAWPQADYLVRMARDGDQNVQELVLGILLEAGNTDSHYIHRHFAVASLYMPPPLAAIWGKHEIDWLKEGNSTFSLLEDALACMISYLAGNGEIDTALGLASELLAVSEDPKADAKKQRLPEEELLDFSSLEPQTRCDIYRYKKILQKHIPDLAHATPLPTLELLTQLLTNAIVFSLRNPYAVKPHDLSSMQRPAIEDHNQNSDFYLQHHLITAVRDVAEDICRQDPEQVEHIVTNFESIGWNTFRRIALYILSTVDGAPNVLIREHLVSEELFDDDGVHHEFFHLMKRHFGALGPEDKQLVLDRISDAHLLKEILAASGELTDEQKAWRIRYWQYSKLVPIEDYLDAEWRKTFISLRTELEDPEIPSDFRSWHGAVMVGEESPFSKLDLTEMPIDRLIETLKEWAPTGEWRQPTRAGLGATLSDLVCDAPSQFEKWIGLFMDENIPPIYIKSIIRGFHRSFEGKIAPHVAPILRLCGWAVDASENDTGLVAGSANSDLGWNGTRNEIADISQDIIFKDETGLTLEMRAEAWAVLRPLTEDEDPSAETEEKYGGDNMDPLTMSINHTRGKAFHATMSYAMWLCRRIKEKEGRKATLDDMPEVRAILDRNLDVENSLFGKRQTDRAIYGQWLPQLVHVGEAWVRDNLHRIFPTEPTLSQLRQAALNTYLLYSRQLYHNVTQLMLEVYKEELLDLNSRTIDEDTHELPEARMVEHIIIFYLWSEYELDTNSPIDMLFSLAPETLTSHALDFIGRDTEGGAVPDPKVLQRMRELWDWRISTVGGIESMPKGELSAFGWWFAGGQFDTKWSVEQLEKVLQRTGVGHANMHVFERMSDIFPDFPAESLRCLELFIEKNDDPWFFEHKEKGVWSILEQGMQFPEPHVRKQAEDIIHDLGAIGHLAYRDLLALRA